MPVFATVLFPVFSWSMIWFFQKMPGWQPFLGTWAILSILAYALAFALLESLIFLGLLVTLAAILPTRALRTRFVALASSVDLVPTLLDVMGRPIPAWCEGQVLPAMGGKGAGDSRAIYAVEAKRNAAHHPLHTGTVALILDRYKLIHYLGNPGFKNTFELYDLVSDPEELENLYTCQSSIAGDLRRELVAKLGEVNQPYFSLR